MYKQFKEESLFGLWFQRNKSPNHGREAWQQAARITVGEGSWGLTSQPQHKSVNKKWVKTVNTQDQEFK